MPIQPCPQCQAPTARLLDETSAKAWVNYYRCERCGHVWTLPKHPDGDAQPRDITARTPESDDDDNAA